MVAGRIEIDDVAPVVSGGRFPAKAVVGEIVPVRATVWREGHDAVRPRWWCAITARRIRSWPTIRRDGVKPRGAGADRGRGQPAARGSNRSCCRCRWAGHPTCSTASSARQRRVVDLPRRRLGRPDRDVAQERHRQARRRPEREPSCPTTCLIGARLLERAATGVPRQRRYPLIDAAARLRDAR